MNKQQLLNKAFRVLLLASWGVNQVMAGSVRLMYDSNPDPDAPEGIFESHGLTTFAHTKTATFTNRESGEYVVSATERLGQNINNFMSLDNGSVLKKALEKTIGNVSGSTAVDYSLAPCRTLKIFEKDPYTTFEAIVHGLTEADCARFIKQYNKYAKYHYNNTYYQKIGDYTLALMCFAVITTSLMIIAGIVSGWNRPGSSSQTPMLRAYRLGTLTTPTGPKLSETPGISGHLKDYLKNIEENPVPELTQQQLDNIQRKHPEFFCVISGSLMKMPVRIYEHYYDFPYLLPIPAVQGAREHPQTRETFTLIQVEAARDLYEQIKSAVEEELAITSTVDKNSAVLSSIAL